MDSLFRYTDRTAALSHICRCGNRWDCGECWGYAQQRANRRIRERLTAQLHSGRVAVHMVVQVGDEWWMAMLMTGSRALRHAGKIRRRHIRRKKPGPLSGIVCGEWYPHFVIASGTVRPHFHGGLIIDAGHDPTSITDELSEVMSGYGASVKMIGERTPGVIGGYLTRERLNDDPEIRRDIESVMKGKRGPSWKPITHKPTAGPTVGRTGPDDRHMEWRHHWAAVAAIVDDSDRPDIEPRLVTVHRVIEAAYTHATACGRDTIELSVRRIAELIGESKSSIDRDLQLLTSHGIIERIHTTKGNPTEYRYHGYQSATTTASRDTSALGDATR